MKMLTHQLFMINQYCVIWYTNIASYLSSSRRRWAQPSSWALVLISNFPCNSYGHTAFYCWESGGCTTLDITRTHCTQTGRCLYHLGTNNSQFSIEILHQSLCVFSKCFPKNLFVVELVCFWQVKTIKGWPWKRKNDVWEVMFKL